MLAQSESSINQLCAVRFIALMLTALYLPISYAAEAMLQADDLMNPERLLAYRKQAAPKDREMSEKIYQHAVEATKRDWASAVKSFAESALAYPNSRALVKMSESRLRMLAKKDINAKLSALSDVAKYLNSALILNVTDQMLDIEEKKQTEQDKNCIEQYLAIKKRSADCRPFAWINFH